MRGDQPTLSDGEVFLTPFSVRDIPAMVEADRDPEMSKRFDFPQDVPSSPDASRLAIRRWRQGWRTGRVIAFAVRRSKSSALIGGCEIRIDKARNANVSYFTVARYRNQGVATRAVRLLADFALTACAVDRLEIRAEVDNTASRRVAEKAGFQQEGVLRQAALYRRGRRDLVMYSRLRGDAKGET